MTQSTATDLERGVAAFQAGSPVLIHDFDDREGETDLVYPAGAVTPADVARMRNDAGGLICVALSAGVADAFSLPFLHDVLSHPATTTDHLGYDDRSSFSLPVNHRATYTGITDTDRARTITELARAAAAPDEVEFASEFRSPGHVHLLRAARDLLSERQGHTEFAVALAEAADLPPTVVVCEMLDDETGHALTPVAARDYASRHGVPYLEGARLLERLG